MPRGRESATFPRAKPFGRHRHLLAVGVCVVLCILAEASGLGRAIPLRHLSALMAALSPAVLPAAAAAVPSASASLDGARAPRISPISGGLLLAAVLAACVAAGAALSCRTLEGLSSCVVVLFVAEVAFRTSEQQERGACARTRVGVVSFAVGSAHIAQVLLIRQGCVGGPGPPSYTPCELSFEASLSIGLSCCVLASLALAPALQPPCSNAPRASSSTALLRPFHRAPVDDDVKIVPVDDDVKIVHLAEHAGPLLSDPAAESSGLRDDTLTPAPCYEGKEHGEAGREGVGGSGSSTCSSYGTHAELVELMRPSTEAAVVTKRPTARRAQRRQTSPQRVGTDSPSGGLSASLPWGAAGRASRSRSLSSRERARASPDSVGARPALPPRTSMQLRPRALKSPCMPGGARRPAVSFVLKRQAALLGHLEGSASVSMSQAQSGRTRRSGGGAAGLEGSGDSQDTRVRRCRVY